MSDLIERQAAIDAVQGIGRIATLPDNDAVIRMSAVEYVLFNLPSAQSERIIYANMSDEEFEKWLYEHGICNPDIHDSIPCSAVPLLIDNAISEVPSAQPEIVLCIDCKRYDTHGHRCKFWNHGVTGVDWCSKAEPWRGEEHETTL